MGSVQYIIAQKDGYSTTLHHYPSEMNPNTSILLLHGMAEHMERYITYINFLNSSGIDVYIYNHRGHGTDKSIEELGFFDDTVGYLKVIDDALEVIHFVENIKRTDHFILMGHSMGSLIARNIMQQYDNFSGVILSGTTNPSKLKSYPGYMLASFIKTVLGTKHRSLLINQLIFGGKAYTSFTKDEYVQNRSSVRNFINHVPGNASNPDGKFSNEIPSKILGTRKSQYALDWLTRDVSVVDNYVKDPYCGFICTASFYHDLLSLTIQASNTAFIKKTKKVLPIYLISGGQDPVGNNGKEVLQLFNIYKKYGYSNVTLKLYPECRHELLNELNSNEVMQDIVSWINQL